MIIVHTEAIQVSVDSCVLQIDQFDAASRFMARTVCTPDQACKIAAELLMAAEQAESMECEDIPA